MVRYQPGYARHVSAFWQKWKTMPIKVHSKLISRWHNHLAPEVNKRPWSKEE
jgi:hypothetical protein